MKRTFKSSKKIQIRVLAPYNVTPQGCDLLIGKLNECGFRLTNHSIAYPCRPPKQDESRIYLTFEGKDYA